jgi:peroxiredoxin
MKRPLDTDPYALPKDLPIPVDDGGCRHLQGMEMPSLFVHSTAAHGVNLADASRQKAVFFFYPETGKPGAPIPEDWNEIPGARGCTPQSCAFRDQYREFKKLGFDVFGVSTQNLREQMEFAKRNNLPYELLNDSDFRLTKALRLPTFEFESNTFVKRLAVVVASGRIEKVFYPVFPPDKNADEVLDYLRGRLLGSYRGVIIEESLEDKSILGELRILETEVEKVTDHNKTPWLKLWTRHTVQVPEAEAQVVAERLAKTIDRKNGGSWYADFKNPQFHYVIFRDRVFRVDRRSKQQYDEVNRFGEALGIPSYQLDFSPTIK